jgi:aspartyl-tRNA(Asn)/glutamyl-tRNA(Gln) amidotransferase subunit C
MSITRDDVAKVARLSRLALTEEELQLYTEQLGHILQYVEKLNAVDTAAVEPMVTAVAGRNVFRPDAVKPGLKREDALAAAPDQDEEFFKTPPVIE